MGASASAYEDGYAYHTNGNIVYFKNLDMLKDALGADFKKVEVWQVRLPKKEFTYYAKIISSNNYDEKRSIVYVREVC